MVFLYFLIQNRKRITGFQEKMLIIKQFQAYTGLIQTKINARLNEEKSMQKRQKFFLNYSCRNLANLV